MKCFIFFLFLFIFFESLGDDFFYITIRQRQFSFKYSPKISSVYLSSLGPHYKLYKKTGRNLFLQNNFSFDGDNIISEGWSHGSVISCNFSISDRMGKIFYCTASAKINIVSFFDNKAFVSYVITVTGPVTIVYNYGIVLCKIIKGNDRIIGFTGTVEGLRPDQLLFVLNNDP